MESPRSRTGAWCRAHGTCLCLVAIILVACAVRLMPLPSWPASDSANYVAVAWSYFANDPLLPASYSGAPHDPRLSTGPMAFSVRLGLTWPLAVAIKLFGFSPASFCLVPIAFGLTEVMLAFLIGRAVAGNRAGLLAAAIIATLPWSVGESRYARADQISVTLAYLGVYVVTASPLGSRFGLLSAIVGGALLAWAWLTKETMVFLFAALAVVTLLSGACRPQYRSRVLAVAMTLLLALALECVAYFVSTGDPMYRFHAMAVNHEQAKAGFFTAESAEYGWRNTTYSSALLNRLALSGPKALLLAPASLGLVLAGTVLAVWSLWHRETSRQSPYLHAACYLVLSLLLIYNFGTTSPSEYRPIPNNSVYFYSLVLPSAVIVSAWVVRLAPRIGRPHTVRACIAVALAISASAAVIRSYRNDRGPRYLDSIAPLIAEGARVVTDPQTASELSQRVSGTPLPSSQVIAWGLQPTDSQVDYALVSPAMMQFLRLRYEFEGPPLGELLKDAQLVEKHAVYELWRLPGGST